MKLGINGAGERFTANGVIFAHKSEIVSSSKAVFYFLRPFKKPNR